MIQVLDVVAIVIVGLMVGNEFAIAAFVNPTLDRQADEVHAPTAAAMAGILGRFMPFWYGLVVVLTLADALIRWHVSGRLPLLITAAAALCALSIIFSIIALVPINNRIASWTKTAPPTNWKADRHRWDVFHRWRVLLLIVAFTLLVVGILRGNAD